MMGPNAWPFTWKVYLGTTPPEHPDASPLFGDWRGLAPLHFHVSSQEILLDDSRRAVASARLAGTCAQLSVWHDVTHSFYHINVQSEARRCRAEIVAFVERVLSDAGQRNAGADLTTDSVQPVRAA